MKFLEECWDEIQTEVPCGIDYIDIKSDGFLRPWTHDNANMDMIVKAVRLLKPVIVIETGTFEGLGTIKIALAMSENGKEMNPIVNKLYTFDVGAKPYNTLGPTYGVPEGAELVDWQDIDGWESWEHVISVRKDRMERDFPHVDLEFVEGITFETLPETLPRIGIWDFCFQDTVHHLEGIVREWDLLKEHSRIGSVIVFDDIFEGHPFIEWFAANEPKWKFKHITIGHGQLWAERIEA